MTKSTPTALAIVLFALGLAGNQTAGATTYLFSATLNQAQDVPPPAHSFPLAHGSGTLLYDDALATDNVFWDLNFDFLSGAPTMAHIHDGAPSTAGPVVIDLGAFFPKLITGFGYYTSVGFLPATFKADLLANNLYFNIHTVLNPAGEIRGQLILHSVLVPLPAAGLLFASGCGLLGWRRKTSV